MRWAAAELAKDLSKRPSAEQLQDKNILKVHPCGLSAALVHAAAVLERERRRDTVGRKIETRPSA